MRLLIVGYGNTLAGDDGAGPRVVGLLRERALPPGVRVEEGGSDATRLPSLWQGEPNVWIVDTVARGDPPGTIHVLEHDRVLAVPQKHESVHRLSLPEALRWIAIAYPQMAGVRYRLFGIEPERVGPPEGLSAAVESAVAGLAQQIRAEISAPS